VQQYELEQQHKAKWVGQHLEAERGQRVQRWGKFDPQKKDRNSCWQAISQLRSLGSALILGW